jgi:hypothetical protein
VGLVRPGDLLGADLHLHTKWQLRRGCCATPRTKYERAAPNPCLNRKSSRPRRSNSRSALSTPPRSVKSAKSHSVTSREHVVTLVRPHPSSPRVPCWGAHPPEPVEDLLSSLFKDEEVKQYCASWIFKNTPEMFVRLLYDIGFLGFARFGKSRLRSSGPKDTTPPPISATDHLLIHPSYWDALDLQDRVVTQVDTSQPYPRVGVVANLPGAATLSEYQMHFSSWTRISGSCLQEPRMQSPLKA